ncbi:MAG: hypothetical protein QOF71_1524 [Candidatus Eremiobacteraeota bacterium]|jgi:hypothetical protein|nr:hypothetical protein [Candidatus Eremiobacteraeota bacterium]
MLRVVSIVAVPVLLATTTSLLLPPRPLTVVAAGPAQAPVVAVAAMVQLRVPAARTAVVIGVDAGSTVVENEARVAAVRDALRAAAPAAEIAGQAWAANNDLAAGSGLKTIGPRQIGGRVVAVLPGTTSGARRIASDAIRTFPFARFDGIENEPADCAAAQAAADAKARAAGHTLAVAAADALGWELGTETASENRRLADRLVNGSRYCRGGDALQRYPLDGGAISDDRSTLSAGYALAFRAHGLGSPRSAARVAADVDFEPGYPRQFPPDVDLVVRQRAMTFVGSASAPIAYAGDMVTYESRSSDDALRDRVRALGLTEVRALTAGSGESVLAVRVPRDGPVQADAVVRLMRSAAGSSANEVASTPYADCNRRDPELVAAAVRDAQRRARVVAGALRLALAAPAAVLVTQPVPRSGCRPLDAALHRDITPAASVVSGAADRFMNQTVVVAVTFPTQPVTSLPSAVATAPPSAESERYWPRPDDVTAPVRPARGVEQAKTTTVRTLAAQRIDLEIGDGPDAANNFRPIDPAAVEKAVAPWIAGVPSTRTHVTVQPISWKPEHRADVTIGFRLDGIPPGFTEQSRITDTVKRLGALGYPSVQYVARSADCRAASDAATVEAVRSALAGAPPSAIVVGPAVVRHGGCGNGAGILSNAWWNQGVDATVRIEVTARVFR